MELAEKIESIIQAPLHDIKLDIVRVMFLGSKNKVLQIMIERQDGEVLTVDDCSEASFVISTYLDLENPIKSAYNLEVSSPGLDRPLVKQKDYVRFCGREVVVKTLLPIDGSRRFYGVLGKADDWGIVLVVADAEGGQVSIAYSDIKSAKLYVDHKSLFSKTTEGLGT